MKFLHCSSFIEYVFFLSCITLANAAFSLYSVSDWIDFINSLKEDFGCSGTLTTSQTTTDCRCGTRPGSTRTDLGRITERVVNGQNVVIDDFPWNVQIGDTSGVFCGGSIISDRHIITAAHCIINTASEIRVRMASTTISGTVEILEVESVKVHDQWNTLRISDGYDIALLTLKTTITFNDKKQPVCLPCKSVSYNIFQEGDITGWGKKLQILGQSNTLQQAKSRAQSASRCRKTSRRVTIGEDANVICGRSFITDTCQGDSGGPFTLESDDIFYLIGLTSYGVGCNRFLSPGVYTDVSKYVDWIDVNTRDGTYCTAFA